MARIKLYDFTNRAEESRLTMLDFEGAAAAVTAYEAENPVASPYVESDLDHIPRLAEDGINTSRALTEIAYAIAPQINEARATDIAFVQNAAASNGATLGLSEEEMFDPDDVVVEGQQLVLEGFKKRAFASILGLINLLITIGEIIARLLASIISNTSKDITKITTIIPNVGKSILVRDDANFDGANPERFGYLLSNGSEKFTMENVLKNAISASEHYAYAHTSLIKYAQMAGKFHEGLKTKPPSMMVPDVMKVVDDFIRNLPKSEVSGLTFSIPAGDQVITSGSKIEQIAEAMNKYTLVADQSSAEFKGEVPFFSTADLKSKGDDLLTATCIVVAMRTPIGLMLTTINSNTRSMKELRLKFESDIERLTSKSEEADKVRERAIGGEMINVLVKHSNVISDYARQILNGQAKRIKLVRAMLEAGTYPEKDARPEAATPKK